MNTRLIQWLTVGLILCWLKGALGAGGEFRVIPAHTITQRVETLIASHFQPLSVQYRIEWLTPPTPWKVEQQVDSIAVTPPPNQRWRGNITVNLVAFGNGQVLRRRTVSLRVRTFQPVVVLQQTVRRGQAIPQAALQLANRETTFLRGEPLTTLPEDTLYARRNLSPGNILTRKDVRISLLVRRGEIATVLFQTPRFKITLKAQALADAGEGETIWFIRPENRKRIRATVIGPHLAVIQSQNRGMLP